MPDGVDPEPFEVLADICALASVRDAVGDLRIGCRTGPPFDAPDARPDGRIEEKKDLNEVCFIDGFHRGSFSGVDQDEAVLGLVACGADRLNDISPGSVVLARKEATGWRTTAVIQNTNVHQCRVAERTDRTLLVCRDGIGAYGDGSLSWRFTLDFTKPRGKRMSVFAKLYASAGFSCLGGLGMVEERGVTVVEQVDERFHDRNGDGLEDLTVTVSRGNQDGSDALLKRAQAICNRSKGDPILPLDKLVGPMSRHRLVFDGTAAGLTATPATRKLLDEWGAEAPTFWWNVVK
jgi:hypothetical protein